MPNVEVKDLENLRRQTIAQLRILNRLLGLAPLDDAVAHTDQRMDMVDEALSLMAANAQADHVNAFAAMADHAMKMRQAAGEG